MLRKATRATLLVLAAFHCLSGTSLAALVTYGPTPYRSVADSPFASLIGAPGFYLEDFEDGELNTPGIVARRATAFDSAATVEGPSPLTDSVDGDDGILDESNDYGYSLRSGTHLTAFSDPPQQQLIVVFDFESIDPDGPPNAFGCVWTDGAPNSNLALEVTTISGEIVMLPGVFGLGDGARESSVLDDVFVGFQGMEFSRVRVFSGYVGDSAGFDYFELDHIQYGRVAQVPEGTTFLMLLVCFLGGAPWPTRASPWDAR